MTFNRRSSFCEDNCEWHISYDCGLFAQVMRGSEKVSQAVRNQLSSMAEANEIRPSKNSTYTVPR